MRHDDNMTHGRALSLLSYHTGMLNRHAIQLEDRHWHGNAAVQMSALHEVERQMSHLKGIVAGYRLMMNEREGDALVISHDHGPASVQLGAAE